MAGSQLLMSEPLMMVIVPALHRLGLGGLSQHRGRRGGEAETGGDGDTGGKGEAADPSALLVCDLHS